jgi:hypothetical protein
MLIRKTIHAAYTTIQKIMGHRVKGGESPAGRSLSQIDPGFTSLFELSAIVPARLTPPGMSDNRGGYRRHLFDIYL